MNQIDKIQSKITSSEPETLKQCLSFIKDRLQWEIDRGKRAEGRATTMLTLIGIVTAVVIHFTDKHNETLKDELLISTSLFVSALFLLLKSGFYACKALSITFQKRITPQLIINIQDKTAIDALKKEIAALIWEYDQWVKPNSIRLYYLNKCQWALAASIILLSCLSFLIILKAIGVLDVPNALEIPLFLILLIVGFCSDKILINHKWDDTDETYKSIQ